MDFYFYLFESKWNLNISDVNKVDQQVAKQSFLGVAL